MQEWTINNVSLADLGIDSLQLHLQNQDDDYVDIRFPRNYDAALPDGFDVDAPLVVRCGSTVVLRGEVATPFQPASAFAEYRSVFAYGPWHRFREMPFLYMYPYVTGAALSTHGVLGGNASDLLTAILTTNTDGIVQVGTIDVGSLAIPETEVYDQTLAQALQAVLRYIPGAVVAFDYSTAPPTVHIVADNSASLTSVPIDVNDGLNSAFNLSPLYARLLSGVTLQYEVTGSVCLSSQIWNQPDSYLSTFGSPDCTSGFYIAGTDSAGDARSRRHFRRTLRIDGNYDHSIYQLAGQLWTYQPYYSIRGGPFTFEDLITFPGSESGSTLNNTKLMVDRAMFFSLFWDSATNFTFSTELTPRPGANAGNLIGSGSFISQSPSGGTENWRYLRPLMRIGPNHISVPSSITSRQPCKWSENKLSASFFQSSGSAGLRVWASTYGWEYTNTNGLSGSVPQLSAGSRMLWIDTRTLGSVNSATGQFNYMMAAISCTPTPYGIAAQLLAANSRLLYEGRLTRLLDDPSVFAGLNRKVLFTNLAVSALVQRLSYDTATNLADLTFGAPTHLGPQDLIALQRAGKSPA